MPVDEYTPTVENVGALLRARTKSMGDQELGTFTEETRPTDSQVSELIRQATGRISLLVGDDVPVALQQEVKDAAVLGTALLIELSYFPEQVASGTSAYDEYKELYDELIGTRADPGSLVLAVLAALDDGTVDAADSLPATRSNFPPATPLVW